MTTSSRLWPRSTGSRAITEARDLLDEADTSDPGIASDVAQLKPRVAGT